MKSNMHYFAAILLFVFFVGCTPDKEEQADQTLPQFELLSPVHTGVSFQNTITETPQRNIGGFDYFYNGGGVAVGDLNGDDRPDIYFTGNDTPNQLYFNKGNLQFQDVTSKAGVASEGNWSTGVTLVDINADGHLDIYVCNSGPYNDKTKLANQLYVNNKDGTFTERAKEYGIADDSRSTQAAFFDMDLDGDLDLFVMNHTLRNYGTSVRDWFDVSKQLPPEVILQESNTLFRNEGNGQFTDITEASGVSTRGFGLGLVISDFDEDGLPDIYVANDYFIPDFLFLNQGNGTFKESIKTKISHISYFSMGCDLADINNDGLMDLAIADMTPADHYRNKTLMESMDVAGFDLLTKGFNQIPQYMFNTLQLNQGLGFFSEIGLMAGVAQTDWSWAVLLADYDNDGLKDLLITNGFLRDTKDNDWKAELALRRANEADTPELYYDQLQKAPSNPIPNTIFQNQGNLTFQDKTTDWGLYESTFSQGAAYADLDSDGDLDLVINNLQQPAYIYKNNADARSNNHFVRFQLSSNHAYNAKVTIEYEGQQQLVENAFTRGYQSYVEPVVHFGLGQVDKIDRLIIHWANGMEQIIEQPAINKTHKIVYDASKVIPKTEVQRDPLFVNIIHQQKGIDFRHQENTFNDFEKEILLPHSQSMLGPALTVGDINGDGFDDFFIGGAKDQAGEIYVQNQAGIFSKSESPALVQDAKYEDIGALLFDADQDGDLDLYVCSGGGGDIEKTPELLQDRLYLNDGNGQFSLNAQALPPMNSSTACVTAADWDKDGDLDLFVGGRTTPGQYPNPPASFLLENNNGSFLDASQKSLPDLNNLGMVTQAMWTDLDEDTWPDLMIVGEWMPILVYKNNQGVFEDKTAAAGLADLKGWWYSIGKGDFDQDGDEDFIVGNLGLNNKFHPSTEKPLDIFWEDFDQNGSKDIVLSKYYKGNKVPVRGKECSSQQMPFLNEKFPTYALFASAPLNEIYGADQLEHALHYEVNTFASLYLSNEGNFQFKQRELPVEAQLAPILGQAIYDFNRDGHLDVVIGGNNYQTEVETPAYDAGRGLFLKGQGNGTFEANQNMFDSGIFMPKDVKNLRLFLFGKDRRPGVLVANNNDRLQMFVYRK